MGQRREIREQIGQRREAACDAEPCGPMYALASYCTLSRACTLYTISSVYTVHYRERVHCTLSRARTLHTISSVYTAHYLELVHCTLSRACEVLQLRILQDRHP
jgi:hypothetical protein